MPEDFPDYRPPDYRTREEKMQERLKSPAVEYMGDRFLGSTHDEAWARAAQRHPDAKDLHPEDKKNCEGFATTQNRFISRQEALTIARRTNQVRESEWTKNLGTLTSQDFIP